MHVFHISNESVTYLSIVSILCLYFSTLNVNRPVSGVPGTYHHAKKIVVFLCLELLISAESVRPLLGVHHVAPQCFYGSPEQTNQALVN